MLVLSMLILCSLLQSHPPSAAPRKDGGSKQKKNGPQRNQLPAENDQTQTPVTINQFYSQPRNGPEGKAPAEHKHGPSLEEISTALLALFTLILAGATFVLARVAYLQWKTMEGHERALKEMATNMASGLTETTKAANAAKDSAEAAKKSFIASHRPRLTIRFVDTVYDIGEAGKSVSGDYLVFNTGGTTATLRRHSSEVVFGDGLPKRSKQYFEPGLSEAATSIVLHAGQSAILNFPTGVPKKLEPDEYIAIRARQRDASTNPMSGASSLWHNLYLIGWIGYVDESNETRRTGFCRKYDFAAKRFILETDHDYEYED